MNSTLNNPPEAPEDLTHFGFESVPVSQKQGKVAQVFDSVASRYDLMNDVMSLGVHRLWKQLTIAMAPVRPGNSVLDLAGGTGDLTVQFSKKVGPKGQVVMLDINGAMLNQGRDRLMNLGLVDNIHCIQADAEALPLPNNSFHCITMAFGLRNVTCQANALKEMYRVLKPGGQALILEFSEVTLPGLKQLYDFYSFSCLPQLGQWIANDRASYQYLVESIRKHPNQPTLQHNLFAAGFDRSDYLNFSGGIVALHRGIKY